MGDGSANAARSRPSGRTRALREATKNAARYALSATSTSALSPIAIEKNSVSPPSTAPSRFQPNARSAAGLALKRAAKHNDANKIGAPTNRKESAKRTVGDVLRSMRSGSA
jgi:hypothetical protein